MYSGKPVLPLDANVIVYTHVYHYILVKYYLQKTGKSIEEATILPADVILSEVEEFWSENVN